VKSYFLYLKSILPFSIVLTMLKVISLCNMLYLSEYGNRFVRDSD